MEAFKLREMWNLLTLFDIKSFIKVICAVIPSQLFTISVVIGFSDEFDLIELLKSISTFFLAPFFYIAAKRFVGLNVRELISDTK